MTTADDEAPKILDLPIGLNATGMRKEFDSLGDVEVPADRYWGAQTQRSLQHFNIGHDRMPKEVYHAYGYVKKAAAVVNTAAGRLPAEQLGGVPPDGRRPRPPKPAASGPWTPWQADFLDALRSRGQSAATLSIRAQWLPVFQRFCEAQGVEP